MITETDPTTPPPNLPVAVQRDGIAITVISSDLAQRGADLVSDFEELPKAATPENVTLHDTFAAKAKKWLADLEAARETAKAPSLAEGRAIDAVAKRAAKPVTDMLDVASAAVLAVKREVEAKRQRAEAEQRRIQAEVAAREKALAEQRELVAQGGSAADAKALDELEHEHRSAGQTAYLDAIREPIPEPLKTSVKEPRGREVVIDNDADVPVYVAGVCIRPVDHVAARKLMVAGVAIPGCHLEKKGA